MSLDGSQTQVELLRDLGVADPVGDELEDVRLPRRERYGNNAGSVEIERIEVAPRPPGTTRAAPASPNAAALAALVACLTKALG